jgi:hypothetical protein
MFKNTDLGNTQYLSISAHARFVKALKDFIIPLLGPSPNAKKAESELKLDG